MLRFSLLINKQTGGKKKRELALLPISLPFLVCSPPVSLLIKSETWAPSTRIRIFLKTHLFLSVLGLRPHGDGVFGHQKRSFSNTLSRVDLFENAVFILSCGQVKTELSKTLTSQHRFTTKQSMRTDLWGSRKDILIVCFLLSKFEQRSLNAAVSSCGRGCFRKRSSCGRGYLFIRIKKDVFSKISGYVWTRPWSKSR